MKFQEFLEKKGFDVISEDAIPEVLPGDKPRTPLWRRALQGLGFMNKPKPASPAPSRTPYAPMAWEDKESPGGLGSTHNIGSQDTKQDYLLSQFSLIHNAQSRIYNSANSLLKELERFPKSTSLDAVRKYIGMLIPNLKAENKLVTKAEEILKQAFSGKLSGKGNVLDRAQQLRRARQSIANNDKIPLTEPVPKHETVPPSGYQPFNFKRNNSPGLKR